MLKLGKDYFVKFTHKEPESSLGFKFEEIFNRNDIAHVTLTLLSGYQIEYSGKKQKCICELFKGKSLIGGGMAICQLEFDKYDKSIGRKISFTRALKNSGLNKSIRTSLWEEYRKIIN